MKTMEQIKLDVKTAKDKLIEKFGEQDTLDVTQILDSIFVEESLEQVADESVQTEEPIEKMENGEKTPEVEQVETVIIDENQESIPAEAVKDEISVEVDAVENAGETKEITAEEYNNINEILKTKILEIITRDIDDIIAEIAK